MQTWYQRPAARSWTCPPAPAEVVAFHAGLPGYAPTPLVELPGLAAELGVGRVFVKDESARLGLPAFKVLGVSWALCRLLCARAGVSPAGVSPAGVPPADAGLDTDLDRLRTLARALTPPRKLVTATEGNHGRALARMARLLGLPADVYLPSAVPATAAAAIAAEGATVIVVDGPYDEAVARAAAAATADREAELVQDTAWPGYQEVPRWIVQGYATLFHEIDAQLHAAAAPPATLLAVPVGVGSLAQAAITHHRSRPPLVPPPACVLGVEPPAPTGVLGVEPAAAAGVLASLLAGRPLSVPTATTVMAGLNCGTPSSLAWPYLRAGMDAAIAIGDEDAIGAVRDLARFGVPAGPSGAASLAGARAALKGPGSYSRRTALAAGPAAVVVLLSTEGPAATSPATP